MLASEKIANLLITSKINQAGYETIESGIDRREVISAYNKLDAKSPDWLKNHTIDLYILSCDQEITERRNTDDWVSRYNDPTKRAGSAWNMTMLAHTNGCGILGINNKDPRVQSILAEGRKVYETN